MWSIVGKIFLEKHSLGLHIRPFPKATTPAPTARMQQPRPGYLGNWRQPSCRQNNNNTLKGIKTQCFQRVANIVETSSDRNNVFRPDSISTQLNYERGSWEHCEPLRFPAFRFFSTMRQRGTYLYLFLTSKHCVLTNPMPYDTRRLNVTFMKALLYPCLEMNQSNLSHWYLFPKDPL